MPPPHRSGFLATLKRRKYVVLVGAWALIIAVFAFSASSPTVREQTTATEALGELDRATGDVAGLVSGQPYGFAVSGLIPGEPCDITPARSGEQYSRAVTVYAPSADHATLIKRLSTKLRDRYGLYEVSEKGQRARFTGEGDKFVDYTLTEHRDWVTWTAATGCRPKGDAVGDLSPDFEPPATLAKQLSVLKVDSARWNRATTTCGDLGGPGGRATTVTAAGRLPAGAAFSALTKLVPHKATVVVSGKNLLSYRSGDTSWSAVESHGTVTVNQTHQCSGS